MNSGDTFRGRNVSAIKLLLHLSDSEFIYERAYIISNTCSIFVDSSSTHLHGRMESTTLFLGSCSILYYRSFGRAPYSSWGVTLWLFPQLTEKNKFQRHLPFISIWVFPHHI